MREELTAADREGRLVLLAVYVAMLAGTFSLRRLNPGFPSAGLRELSIVLCLVAVWAWRVVQRGRLRSAFPTVGVEWWFLMWIGYSALSGLWAPYGAEVGLRLGDLAAMTGFLFLARVVASRVSVKALSAVFAWLLATALVYLLDALAAGPEANHRYSAFLGGPNIFGRVEALGIVAALYYAARYRRTWAFTAVPVFAVGVVLSGSRGAIIAFVVAMFVVGMPLLRRVPAHAWALLAVAGAFGIVVFGAEIVSAVHSSDIYQRFFVQTLQQHYSSGRNWIYSSAWDLGKAHPIFGSGLDGYFGRYGSLHGAVYAHNILLENFADGGLIGVSLVLATLISGGIAIWRWRPLTMETRAAAMAAVFVLFSAMFSGGFYDTRFIWFLGLIAMILARRGHEERVAEAATQQSAEPTSQVRPAALV